MSAEQAFRDSLNSFNNSNNSGGGWFSRLGLGGGRGNINSEESVSLLGNLRTRASDGLSSLGFGNDSEEDNPFGLSRFHRYVSFFHIFMFYFLFSLRSAKNEITNKIELN